MNVKTVKIFVFTLMMICHHSAWSIDLFGGSDGKTIFEIGKNEYIKLTESRGDVVFQHPIMLDPAVVEKALLFLKLEGENVTGSNVVFTAKQAKILATQISRALSKANHDEEVDFVLKQSVKSIIWKKKSSDYFVAGKIFYVDDRLNIILGEYDRARVQGIEDAYDPTHMGITRYNFNHGQFSGDSKAIKLVQLNDGAVNLHNSRGDWVTINLIAAAEHYDAEIANIRNTELQQRRNEYRELFGRDVGRGYSEEDRVRQQKESIERRKLREEMARMRQEMETGRSNSNSAEVRLTKLRELKSKGLITQEEYVEKRKAILEDL